jgi:triphosphoribosyl-dephospho-CoA synthase
VSAAAAMARRRPIVAADIAAAAQLACLLEASAPKPGNVSPFRRFEDAGYEDFLASAAAIGAPLAEAGGRPLGATILHAVEASARWTRSNTNLGIVLLLAPLARAAFALARREVASGCGRPGRYADAIRSELRSVLNSTTVADARQTYAAIRLAAPGGLGRVESQDVSGEPGVTLVEAMRLAADRDGIAREYATVFSRTFEDGVAALERARGDGLGWKVAIVETFLTLLAAAPDTHVARRGGQARADEVLRHARAVVEAGGVRSDAGRRAIIALDAALGGERHLMNPGTTADLTAAAIFVALLGGAWA